MVTENQIAHWLGGRSFADIRKQYDRDGYMVFENVLSADQVAEARTALEPYLAETNRGRNDFEGLKTNRIYALLAKGRIFSDLVTHPLALAFAEADLGASCLLSACLAIKLHPGETVQPWHYDDAHMEVLRPRPAWGVSTFWALDDTTAENGATELLPGSHRWPDTHIQGSMGANAFTDTKMRSVEDDPAFRADAVKATMPAGSFMVAKSTLWHRGGSNRSENPRLIITPQYCVGWARQLENMVVAVPKEMAATLPRRAQELIGYSIHPPFMGYVDGMHPARALTSS